MSFVCSGMTAISNQTKGGKIGVFAQEPRIFAWSMFHAQG